MNVSPRLRRLFDLAKGRCHYCDCEMTLRRNLDTSATIDHKLARASGGSNHRRNVVAACWSCNHAKGTMPYDIFVTWVRRHGRPTDSPGHPQVIARKKARSAESIAREKKVIEGDAPWTRKRSPARTYLAEIGRYQTLADIFREAGIGPQSTLSEGCA